MPAEFWIVLRSQHDERTITLLSAHARGTLARQGLISQVIPVDDGRRIVHKRIYVGRATTEKARLSNEHLEYAWHEAGAITELVHWDTSREAFQQVLNHLRGMNEGG